MLNLCCGPTLSFKDFGARFLAECIHSLSTQFKTTIMVATSGDTGSAVASAFYEKENIQVILLYPKGKVSKKQEHQLNCWDKNILSLAVDGTFDDCQKLVKDAFNNNFFKNTMRLSSANSINIGRLLPQICYYAYTSVKYVAQYKTAPGFIIPTGNLGNATAAFWAKEMGFPIREIVLSTNENKVLEDYISTGDYKPRKSILTLANAMDVGNPSNFERLASLFPTYELFKKNVSVTSVSNKQIEETIKDVFNQYNTIICPHTATAFYARKQLSNSQNNSVDSPWIVVSTADPCKFDDIIEPIIQKKVPLAPQMEELLIRDVQYKNIAPNLEEVKRCAVDYFKIN